LNIEVKRDWMNKLLNRRELDLIISYESSTPRRDEVRKLIAERYGVEVERVIVEKLESMFGMLKAKAHVHIYDTVEDAKRIERRHILRRHGLLEEVEKAG